MDTDGSKPQIFKEQLGPKRIEDRVGILIAILPEQMI